MSQHLVCDGEVVADPIRMAEELMAELETQHPDWFAIFDDCNPESGTREELYALLQSAPNQFAYGVVYGMILVRQELAAFTGREFG